ncbi:MAG TPA: hypothetical protein VKZ18_17225 [Polyangia bacterium]|nr:hypothetical protein [Polyangia bacterium]
MVAASRGSRSPDGGRHFARRAAFVAALPPDDRARAAAEAHARRCARCRQALAEGTRLLELLRRAAPAPQLPAPRLALRRG